MNNCSVNDNEKESKNSQTLTICSRTSAMIDLLRGVFAILVVFAHATPIFAIGQAKNLGIWGFAEFVLANAGFWVSGFFVLSGFCIHLSITNMRGKEVPHWRFYFLARFTRVYPMAVVGLVVAALVWLIIPHQGISFPWVAAIATIFMMQNLIGLFPSFGQSWSLTNEVIYYAAWPVFLRLTNWEAGKALKVAAGTALGWTFFIVLIWKSFFGGRADHWLVPVWSISASTILWLAGAALLHYWPAITTRFSSTKCLILLPVSSMACVLFFLASYWEARSWVMHLATYLSIPFFYFLVLIGRHISILDHAIAVRFCNLLGIISYPVYIFHNQILSLFRHWDWQKNFTPGLSHFHSYLFLVFVVLVITGTLGGWLEVLLLRKRSIFLKRSRPV